MGGVGAIASEVKRCVDKSAIKKGCISHRILPPWWGGCLVLGVPEMIYAGVIYSSSSTILYTCVVDAYNM